MRTTNILKRATFYICNVLLCATALIARPASAADLLQVYQMAVQHDAQYQQAVAANLATQEQKPQALAQLLPNANLSANTTNSNSYSNGGFNFGGQTTFDTNQHGYTFSMTQPLFSWDRYLQLRKADATIAQADATLNAAKLDLIVRVANAYFNILAAEDNLAFAKADTKSLSRQLDQTNQRFEVGLTAITDVQEARSGYDRAVAAEIVAENNVDNTREALREIIGDYVTNYSTLKEEIPLVKPDPDSIEQWTQTALKQNLDIMSELHAVDAAREQVKIYRAGHLPTVELQGSHTFNYNSGGRFGANKNKADNIGLQLSLPLYSGGMVNSRTRQAVHQLDQELQKLVQAQRASQKNTRQSYLGVISGISQVEAYKQAVVSSETALQAVQAGFEVGTRTAVDVVTAESNLSQNKKDYARSRYDYLINTLKLKQAAGILSEDDVTNINLLLQK